MANPHDPLDDPHSREFMESAMPYSPEPPASRVWMVVAIVLALALLAIGVYTAQLFWMLTFRG